MEVRAQEIRDPKTGRLLGIFYPENSVFEMLVKGRIMRIRFPPNTPLQFDFDDSKPAA